MGFELLNLKVTLNLYQNANLKDKKIHCFLENLKKGMLVEKVQFSLSKN